MADFAQFIAVPNSDDAFVLPNSQTGLLDQEFQFDLPSLDTKRTVVVLFKVTPRGPVRLLMRANAGNAHFIDYSFEAAERVPRTWHEIVPGDDFQATANTLVVSISGQGSVLLSDIILFYHGHTIEQANAVGML